jgi:oligopeptide/dipeptide ABC transporter ATP-binding protein
MSLHSRGSRTVGESLVTQTKVRSPELLSLREIVVEYGQGRRSPRIRALDGVSLHIDIGETLGLVGESGSGKSTLGGVVLGLVDPVEGRTEYLGREITRDRGAKRRDLSRDIQAVFQDPYSSLNPSRTIGKSLVEPILVHGRTTRVEAESRAIAMLGRVGLPEDAIHQYPSAFSGGQLQRISIARSLVVSPKLVICDEIVSALDLSVQAQVLNLLVELQRELGVAYLFIAHDLDVVRYVSKRVVVLYHGQVMETGFTGDVYNSPQHPYTQALLAAAPLPDPARQRERRSSSTAEPPSPSRMEGCPFAPRCPFVIEVCKRERPALRAMESGSSVACHRADEINGAVIVRRVAITSGDVTALGMKSSHLQSGEGESST